jgi:delta-aminolevulinic acid dehydratase/porphobilinogen synthase
MVNKNERTTKVCVHKVIFIDVSSVVFSICVCVCVCVFTKHGKDEIYDDEETVSTLDIGNENI